MTDKTGEPAFPVWSHQGDAKQLPGMTLRDYFAAKAMQGILSAGIGLNVGPNHAEEMEGVAKTFYLMADAMIAARDE